MDNKKIPYKIYLNEDEMPKQWYNVRADMKNKPAPLLNQFRRTKIWNVPIVIFDWKWYNATYEMINTAYFREE